MCIRSERRFAYSGLLTELHYPVARLGVRSCADLFGVGVRSKTIAVVSVNVYAVGAHRRSTACALRGGSQTVLLFCQLPQQRRQLSGASPASPGIYLSKAGKSALAGRFKGKKADAVAKDPALLSGGRRLRVLLSSRAAPAAQCRRRRNQGWFAP